MPGTNEHVESAIEALAKREYERAGNAYTRAAWHHLAAPRDGQDPFTADEKGWIGYGLQWLTTAAAAYRVAGCDDRATRRCVEGVAIAKDLRGTVDRPGQSACLLEYVGDFRTVGSLNNASEAYETAGAAYRESGDAIDSPQSLATTPLFEAAAGTIKQVARSTANGEIAITWENMHGSDPTRAGDFLAARTQFKRNRFPSLLEAMLDAGYLAAPRGTTEYNNDQYRCPDCGSNDVNWTGDSTLCMRCSRPLERA